MPPHVPRHCFSSAFVKDRGESLSETPDKVCQSRHWSLHPMCSMAQNPFHTLETQADSFALLAHKDFSTALKYGPLGRQKSSIERSRIKSFSDNKVAFLASLTFPSSMRKTRACKPNQNKPTHPKAKTTFADPFPGWLVL